MDFTAEGDTILIAPGEYSERGILIDKDIKIYIETHFLTTGDSSYIDQTIFNANLTDSDNNGEKNIFKIVSSFRILN